jgi:hypothetical protein
MRRGRYRPHRVLVVDKNWRWELTLDWRRHRGYAGLGSPTRRFVDDKSLDREFAQAVACKYILRVKHVKTGA